MLGESLYFTDEVIVYETTGVGLTGMTDSSTLTSTAKILYNSAEAGTDTTVITVSALVYDTIFEIDIQAGYDGSIIAVMLDNRYSTQFTFNSADAGWQVLSASGFICQSDTMRRLRLLGII